MTEKTVCLFYDDVYCREFQATVLSCQKVNKHYEIILDQTAFYPEGGGQPGDQGYLSNVAVRNTYYRDDIIVHQTDEPLEAGTSVSGRLDWPLRYARMQEHTGEHIVSGVVHERFGYQNVGFHMSDGTVTIDYNGPITTEELADIERRCHEIITENRPVEVHLYDELEAATIPYRSKKKLYGKIRIVQIPGVDACACCGTHTHTTGEVGAIHFTDRKNYKGGVRLTLVLGCYAVEDAICKEQMLDIISRTLSAEKGTLDCAVEDLLTRLSNAEHEAIRLRRLLADNILSSTVQDSPLTRLHFPDADMRSLIYLADGMAERFTGLCLVTGMYDEKKLFACCNRDAGLRSIADILRKSNTIRGGGSDRMIQGEVLVPFDDMIETLKEHIVQ
ncbi:MAG: alanyl-tRNA editing protein [Eubacteriales bacterium]|nr:alanyl-tRNA editing protein [Eubacteriales bacterium]